MSEMAARGWEDDWKGIPYSRWRGKYGMAYRAKVFFGPRVGGRFWFWCVWLKSRLRMRCCRYVPLGWCRSGPPSEGNNESRLCAVCDRMFFVHQVHTVYGVELLRTLRLWPRR